MVDKQHSPRGGSLGIALKSHRCALAIQDPAAIAVAKPRPASVGTAKPKPRDKSVVKKLHLRGTAVPNDAGLLRQGTFPAISSRHSAAAGFGETQVDEPIDLTDEFEAINFRLHSGVRHGGMHRAITVVLNGEGGIQRTNLQRGAVDGLALSLTHGLGRLHYSSRDTFAIYDGLHPQRRSKLRAAPHVEQLPRGKRLGSRFALFKRQIASIRSNIDLGWQAGLIQRKLMPYCLKHGSAPILRRVHDWGVRIPHGVLQSNRIALPDFLAKRERGLIFFTDDSLVGIK